MARVWSHEISAKPPGQREGIDSEFSDAASGPVNQAHAMKPQ